jgi:hypothetical protein
MMSFGWRPQMSCYASQNQVNQGLTTTQQQASCPTPTWFYLGLALAAFLGISKGGK